MVLLACNLWRNKYALQYKDLSVRFIVGPNCTLNNTVYIIMDCHPTTIASHAFIEASIKHSLEIKGYKSKNIIYNRELVSSIFFFFCFFTNLPKTRRSAGKEPLVNWSIVMIYCISIVICGSSLRWYPWGRFPCWHTFQPHSIYLFQRQAFCFWDKEKDIKVCKNQTA